MRLLVSVKSPTEARTAVLGGADIIDAKEPSFGSLGQVPSSVLSAIFDRVPADSPISIALGDVATDGEVAERIAAIPIRRATYLKLGFAGVTAGTTVHRLLVAARRAAASRFPAKVVAVAYADAALARSASPAVVCRAAADAGVEGMLLDTYSKAEGDLFSWIPLNELTELLGYARALGLMTAVAGKLRPGDLKTLHPADPDVVGFRGALCVGGREGRLSLSKVRLARFALHRLHRSEFLQGAV